MGKEAIDIKGKVLDINVIRKILPHRYPFLLVDRILYSDEKRAVGIKNVTINEPFFQGHFPGHPIMPGVLIIEAMAQVAGVAALNMKDNIGKIAYFISIDNARFRKPVSPGDRVVIEADLLKAKMGIVKAHAVAKVDDVVVAETNFMFAFVSPDKAE